MREVVYRSAVNGPEVDHVGMVNVVVLSDDGAFQGDLSAGVIEADASTAVERGAGA